MFEDDGEDWTPPGESEEATSEQPAKKIHATAKIIKVTISNL